MVGKTAQSDLILILCGGPPGSAVEVQAGHVGMMYGQPQSYVTGEHYVTHGAVAHHPVPAPLLYTASWQWVDALDQYKCSSASLYCT